MKGNDLRNIKTPLKLGEKTFMIAFDFNAMAELEEVLDGGFDEAMKNMKEGKKTLKTLRALVYSSIVTRYNVTLFEVGEMLTEVLTDTNKMKEVSNTIMKAVQLALPYEEEYVEENKEQGE